MINASILGIDPVPTQKMKLCKKQQLISLNIWEVVPTKQCQNYQQTKRLTQYVIAVTNLLLLGTNRWN
jgi:hypothetical protein